MNRFSWLSGRGFLALVIWCSGCVSLERSYPEIRYFAIELQDAANRSNPGGEQTLLMPNLRVSPRYADKNFVYRTSEPGYETDFYNQFLTSPASMISEEMRKALAASHAFKYVVGPALQLPANYTLEGSINALYGDFRNLKQPEAFVEIEFFLHNEDPAKSGIVLHKRYTKAVPLTARSPEALVKGWNQALEAIVAMLITDLGNGKL
jgi:ABC-type uncharacterized transport system auxiliary subunit